MPEIEPFLLHFRKRSLARWEQKKDSLNKRLLRAAKSGHLENPNKMKFQSLDDYMLYLHSDLLAQNMDSLVVFAERILPLIRSDPSARIWHFHEALLIQRRHWKSLARQVMNLVKLLSVAFNADFDQQVDLDLWPDQERLCDAMLRAQRIYGEFAEAEDNCPTLAHRPSVPCSQVAIVEYWMLENCQRRWGTKNS